MAQIDLSPKNLYDHLSKSNAKQRKMERLLEIFASDQIEIEKLLMAGESWGIFIYDAEDGWKTQDFAKIDSKKFFDFVYAGKIPTSDPKKAPSKAAEKVAETPAPKAPKTEKAEKTAKKSAPKQIRKVTEQPKSLADNKPEKIVQKPFNIRLLYKTLLAHNDEGLAEEKLYEYFVVEEKDLRFVLDYLEFKRIFTHDTQNRWYANADEAKNPLVMKTLIGLRNSAILNNEFKKKAMR